MSFIIKLIVSGFEMTAFGHIQGYANTTDFHMQVLTFKINCWILNEQLLTQIDLDMEGRTDSFIVNYS